MANPTQKQHGNMLAPTQVWEENVRRTPLAHTRFRRGVNISAVTSAFGGKFVPLKAIGLLREDGVLNSNVRVNVQMDETVKMLLNPVRVSAMAYFIPKLALPRFKDMGNIDRSYAGEPEVDGNVTPWFEPELATDLSTVEFYKTLGLHKNALGASNNEYLQSYNVLWNFIAAQRSSSLAPRGNLDSDLAPAFWEHTQMKHVKPTFDDALLEGTIPLTVVNSEIEINNLWRSNVGSSGAAGNATGSSPNNAGETKSMSEMAALLRTGVDNISAELQADSVVVSLANIDLARETAAWSRMRTQYQGISEDWMIDQLMAGIRLRDETLRHPILIDHANTSIGMSQRYATDGANLQTSVVDGRTTLDLRLRVPQTTCGGVVMICAQALPEQLYERQKDYYMAAMDVDDLPDRTADELDPQPVVMVRNEEVDESHSAPGDLFGYAPLNHQWNMQAPNLGGRYYRPDPSAPWTEDRNRVWTPEITDPALGPDFYLSTSLPHDVFATSSVEPFEFWTNGVVGVEGLTYFGPALRESQDDYDKVLSQVDASRLTGDGTDVPGQADEPQTT
ncbi:major capsid protein [Microviridae sp.]|nr:major capsid protein [Microviridae sp.]